tara:strand:- start:585 stop:812 length:228 start_codon:yes stop_codon:yes gene_type:complete
MRKQITDKLTTLITAAFALVAALAWNDAIKLIFAAYIKPAFGVLGEMWSMIAYAIVVTIIAVVAAIVVAKISEKM